MFETFIDAERAKGKICILPTQPAYNIKQIFAVPIITRSMQIGVMIQDKSSGKQFFIELPPDYIDPDALAIQLRLALNEACEARARLNVYLKEKENVTQS